MVPKKQIIKVCTSYDYFYAFAWERLEGVLGLDRTTGIPCYSPYIEYIDGCALVCLYGKTLEEQQESFGFTLDEIARSPEFAVRLLKSERGKEII